MAGRGRLRAKGDQMGVEEVKSAAPDSAPESALPDLDALILDFFKILKVAFKMAAIYRMDHPAFKQTVVDFLARLEALFKVRSPLTIGFTPYSLFVDNRFWEDDRTIVELAQLFHFRKVKRLEFRRGLTLDELSRFAGKITLPIRDFIKEGGVGAILKNQRIVHIAAEELDYAQLLCGEGEEIKDIWPYLLMEAVEEDDAAKFGQLAESFEKVAARFNTEDLIQNEERQRHFARFFRYLKETASNKYRTCAQGLLKSLLVVRKVPAEAKFDELRLVISDLSDQDLASTLWEEIIGDDKFDALSFSVFSRIISKERHLKISASLKALFQTDDEANRRAEVERKIRTLLSGTSSQLLSDLYRQTLASLLSEVAFEKKMEIDAAQVAESYRYFLLNWLARETVLDSAVKCLERILEDWESIAEAENLDYLGSLWASLSDRAQELAAQPAYESLRKAVRGLVEGLILRGESGPALDAFVDTLGESLHDPATYLDKIFTEKTATPTLLRAYQTFFGSRLADFTARLEKHKSAVRLLERIADSLQSVVRPVSLDLLKKVYMLGERSVQVHALQAMGGQAEIDERFLFAALDRKDDEIKAEALVMLAKRERSRHVALAKLLNLQSPYGLRNRALIKHIRIVEAKDLRAARPFLKSLAQRKDIWNRRVRQEAFRVLEAWGEG
jgi:hypothetical protein